MNTTGEFIRNTVAVTGGAGGIGSEVVRSLVGAGVPITVIDNNETSLSELKAALPEIDTIACDLSDRTDIDRCASVLQEKGINTIIHCAGYGGPFNDTEHTKYEDWQKVFRINVDSLFLLVQGLLPTMQEQRFGRIVAISSIQGQVGSWGSSAYVASKHALNGLIRTIASEYGSAGITANAVSPGYIKTPMGADDGKLDDYTSKVLARTPTASQGQPGQIATVVGMLIRENMGYMNGSVIVVDGGITASAGIV